MCSLDLYRNEQNMIAQKFISFQDGEVSLLHQNESRRQEAVLGGQKRALFKAAPWVGCVSLRTREAT